jgi:hypothetical protein
MLSKKLALLICEAIEDIIRYATEQAI